MELLRQDKKEIFRAAKEAQAIADLILDRHPRLRLEKRRLVCHGGMIECMGLFPWEVILHRLSHTGGDPCLAFKP